METLNGTIIGGDYFQATLIQPSGSVFGSRCFEDIESAKIWCNKMRNDTLEQVGSVAKLIGLDKPWVLRVTGCPDLFISQDAARR